MKQLSCFLGCLVHLFGFSSSEDAVDAVDGILFQASEVVEWSEAEKACQQNHGKLFQPRETSLDASLFSECNLNYDLWVAATYINRINVGSASMGDPFIRCEMCKIEESCGMTCSYKACKNNVLCEGQYDPHTPVLHERLQNWTQAMQWCSQQANKSCDKTHNASLLLYQEYCHLGCFWTRKVIQVRLQNTIASMNSEGECGILHNGALGFTSCSTRLHSLCERVANTSLETQGLSLCEGNNSSRLINNNITTISSLLEPVGTATSSYDPEESSHKSDTGITIGSVIGSVVFLMMTVIVIICVRRKLLQRTGERKSKHDSQNMTMHTTDKTLKPIYPYQLQEVSLESGSGLTPSAQFESKCGGYSSDIVGQKSNPGKSDFMIDQEESNFNYAKVNKKVNVNSSSLNYNINYESYDHLNNIRKSRDDNVSENVYNTTNFEQGNRYLSTADIMYSVPVGQNKLRDESVGLYDRVNTNISDEYDTTEDLRTDANVAYDHI